MAEQAQLIPTPLLKRVRGNFPAFDDMSDEEFARGLIKTNPSIKWEQLFEVPADEKPLTRAALRLAPRGSMGDHAAEMRRMGTIGPAPEKSRLEKAYKAVREPLSPIIGYTEEQQEQRGDRGGGTSAADIGLIPSLATPPKVVSEWHPIPKAKKNDPKWKKWSYGAGEALLDVGKFFTSPLGVATMGGAGAGRAIIKENMARISQLRQASGAPGVSARQLLQAQNEIKLLHDGAMTARKLMAVGEGAFAADLLRQGAENVGRLNRILASDVSDQEKAREITSQGLGLMFAGLLARGSSRAWKEMGAAPSPKLIELINQWKPTAPEGVRIPRGPVAPARPQGPQPGRPSEPVEAKSRGDETVPEVKPVEEPAAAPEVPVESLGQAVDPAAPESAPGVVPPEVNVPAESTGGATPEGKGRGLLERADALEGVDATPEIKAEALASPESRYEVQSQAEVSRVVREMSDAQLATESAKGPGESNISVAASAERIRRMIAEGRGEEAAAILAEARRATTFGQLVNQYKRFREATPEGVLFLTKQEMRANGLDAPNKRQSAEIKRLAEENIKVNAELAEAERTYAENKKAMEEVSRAMREAKEGKDQQAAAALESQFEAAKKQQADNWARVEKNLARAENASRELAVYQGKLNPKGLQDTLITILQGNLLTPTSLGINIVGNTINMPFRGLAHGQARVIDAIHAYATGRKPEIAIRPFMDAASRMRLLKGQAKEIVDTIRKGPEANLYEIEPGRGYKKKPLNSIQAIKDLANMLLRRHDKLDMPTVGGQVPVSAKLATLMEATVGMPADFMLRSLSVGDIPFRTRARNLRIREFGKLKGLTPEEISRATVHPDLFFSPKELARIELEAARAVFQQENALTKAVSSLNHWFRRASENGWVGSEMAWRTVTPYQRTPINVMGELATFFPPTGLAKLGADMVKSNKQYREAHAKAAEAYEANPTEANLKKMQGAKRDLREAKITAGKVAVGIEVIVASNMLYDLGIVSPSLEGRDAPQKARELTYTEGVMNPGSVNLSALGRWLEGKDHSPQPEDETAHLPRLGVVGYIMGATADIRRDMEKQPEFSGVDFSMSLIGAAGTHTGGHMLELPVAKGSAELIKAIYNKQGGKWMRQMFETAANIPLPNSLAAIDRYGREWRPDMRSEKIGWKGELENFSNRINQKLASFGFSLPGSEGTDKLALRVDLWGEKVKQTPKGANRFLWNLLNVGRFQELGQDPVNEEIHRLFRHTAGTDMIPSLPGNSIRITPKVAPMARRARQVASEIKYNPMPPALYQKYAEMVGQNRRRLVEAAMLGKDGKPGEGTYDLAYPDNPQTGVPHEGPEWKHLNDDQRIRRLRGIYGHGLNLAKTEFLKKHGRLLTKKKPRKGFKPAE
tara:strand:- start:6795 stop:10943 length:4149 start_codon:yes stop_codon:yes gene_type:complete